MLTHTIPETTIEYISEPLDLQGAKKLIGEDNYISVVVLLHFNALLGTDLEGFLDMLSTAATGSDVLMDVDYELLGATSDGDLLFRVSGDVTNCYDLDDEEDKDEDDLQECAECGEEGEFEDDEPCPECGAGASTGES